MKIDVSILPLNDFIFEDIVKDDIPEKYILDENGDLLMTSTILNSQKEVDQLIDFLFNGKQISTEVYRTPRAYVLDLSLSKQFIVDFDHLENEYSVWLDTTHRRNTMDEYGMLMDFIGHIKRGFDKKSLLMVVSTERHSS